MRSVAIVLKGGSSFPYCSPPRKSSFGVGAAAAKGPFIARVHARSIKTVSAKAGKDLRPAIVDIAFGFLLLAPV